MDIGIDLYTPNPKKKYPYRHVYWPARWREMTPEYLDVLRHRYRYTQTDCVRLLAFVDKLLLEVKGEKTEWSGQNVLGHGKYQKRLKYRIKYWRKDKDAKDYPERVLPGNRRLCKRKRKVRSVEVPGPG